MTTPDALVDLRRMIVEDDPRDVARDADAVQELRAEYQAGWFRTAADVLDRWFLKPRAEGPTLAARVIRDQLGADTRPAAVKRVVRKAVEALRLGRG